MSGRPLRIGLIGNLAGGAMMVARPLASLGVATTLFLSRSETALAHPDWDQTTDDRTPLRVVRYGHPPAERIAARVSARLSHEADAARVLPALLRQDLIQSFTGSLFQSSLWTFVFGVLRLRPYVACATGSDLREVATADPGRLGRRMRLFFRKARTTLLLNLDMVRVADALALENARFFPFAIDTARFAPARPARHYGRAEDILYFMPSNLDWGETDRRAGRRSTKGNDRFLRAFARHVASGGCAHLVLLDRGPDRARARALVAELGISRRVTFLPEMTKPELVRHMQMADVVADQFDIGAFGSTGLEAMACGRPVMIHIDESCSARCYDEMPPVVNVRDEDEILVAMSHLADPDTRAEIGARARQWAIAHHDSAAVARRLLALYDEVLGP